MRKGETKIIRKPVEIDDPVKSIDMQSKGAPLSRNRKKSSTPLEFYLPEELDAAYQESGWCVSERIQILTAIARDYKEDKRSAMGAIDMMEKIQWAAMKASGQIQEVAVRTRKEEDGTLTEQDIKTMRLGGIVDAEVIKGDTDEPKQLEEPEEEEDGSYDSGDEEDDGDDEKFTGLFQ